MERPGTPDRRNKYRRILSLGVIAGILCHSSAVAEQQFTAESGAASIFRTQMIDDVGASQRINFSGKLRMLSQRVVASACYTQAGIAADQSRAVLEAAVAEFNLITHALEFGNPDLGIIGPAGERKTRAGITKLNELWAPVAASADRVAQGEGTAEDISLMAEQSADVLGIAVRLVSQISGEYANHAELVQADAMVIDVAGRQRMLSQRMSKNVCLIANGVNVETATQELAGASQVFDASLHALHVGMSDVGITPPPTEAIETNLGMILDRWDGLQPLVNKALEGETLDAEQLNIMFSGANAMTGEMNTVVGMYSEASKIES